MKREGLLKNTVIVVTGDHGEGFGEHGPRMHNGTAYEEGLRVPMVLYGPDHLKLAGRLGGVRQHIDLLPTVLELAGVRLDNPVPGKSLLSTDGHQQMAMQCWYEDYCAVGMNDNGEKLIYWYGKRSLESFDLNMDSLEKNNLAVQWGLADRDSRIQGVFQQLANLRSIYH
jgi:arylsulfatase A-like enzyme